MKPDWRKRKKQGGIEKTQRGVKDQGLWPNEEKNGISLTKVENLESREICEEEEWV